jgi:hypothetical protein
MNKFTQPEIKVVRFATPDVVTTSGYDDDNTSASVSDFRTTNQVIAGMDGDIPL